MPTHGICLHVSPSEDAFPSLFEKKEQQDWWIMKERVGNWSKEKRLWLTLKINKKHINNKIETCIKFFVG